MKKFRLTIIILMMAAMKVTAGEPALSQTAQLSVINMGPGNEVYSIWGHTAIRVSDAQNGIDKVYNYGTFDFNTPNFVLKFIRGKLDYALSVHSFQRTVASYALEGRWVQEQVLNLTQEEKEKLYFLLEENYRSENRFYRYDFFFDNCATRPVKIIQKSILDTIDFGDKYSFKTFRNILDEHLTNASWLDFGIDLLIGVKADKVANPVEQMFMPVYVKDYFSSAKVGKTEQKPVSAEERQVVEETRQLPEDVPVPLRPVWVFLVLLGIEMILFMISIKKRKLICRVYDYLWFVLIAVASAFLFFMWFGTDHLATRSNWNIWWINPLFVLTLFPLSVSARKWLFRLLSFLLIALIACWTLIPQELHIAVLPVILILLLKCIKYGFWTPYMIPETTMSK